jgi:exodeoxyribonuclease VII large subunit
MAQLHALLAEIVTQRLRLERKRWLEANRALLRASPQNRVRLQRQRADELRRAMHRSMALHLRAKRARLTALRAQLDALDPLAILGRGYAVLTDEETGKVISRVEQAAPQSRVRARVSDGEFVARVEEP